MNGPTPIGALLTRPGLRRAGQIVAGAVFVVALAAFSAPGTASGFALLGTSLAVSSTGVGYQRDVRLFNNAADAAANDNLVTEAGHPGAVGAALAIWKGAAAWNSDDPDAGKNFDIDWQGLNANAGGPTGNTVNWTDGAGSCGGGVLAFAVGSPLQNGWRIQFCDDFTWSDGPGSISGSHYDIQSVMAHEYGHALGLNHSGADCSCGSGTATMCPFICNGNTAQRTIAPDDAAGLQAIYGEIPANKPFISGLSGSHAVGGTLTVHGLQFAETVHVKFSVGTSADIDIPGVVYGLASAAGGTEVTLEIPAAAKSGNVLVWRPNNRLSNPYPIEIEPLALWNDLGGGTSGVAGEPALAMSGPLTASSSVSLELTDAAPAALALVFLSFSTTPTDFLGGRLHAFPIDELVVVGTNGAGELSGSAFFPGAASGTQLWFQVGIDDASVPVYAASLSNAVRGTAP